METSDEALAKAASAGDAGAFSMLVARHYDRLFGFAFRLTGNRTEAEDLTQDICLALPARMGGFRGEARFSTWLYRVAMNAATDRQRRAAARTRAADGWGELEIARRAEAEDREDAMDWLQSAMTALPHDLRQTLALTLDEELTHAEAAEVLGISEGTVSWRLSEVRRRLRDMKELER